MLTAPADWGLVLEFFILFYCPYSVPGTDSLNSLVEALLSAGCHRLLLDCSPHLFLLAVTGYC